MNVIRADEGRSCAALFKLVRFSSFAIGLAVLELMGNSKAAHGAEPTTEYHAALQNYLGVWDIQPMNALRERGVRSAATEDDPVEPKQGPGIEGLARGDLRVYRQMTSAGKAAFETMNPRDLPSNNCYSSGVPTLAVMPNAQNWSVDGDVLTIHHASFDTVRHVYLDGRNAAGPPSQLGHAIGEYSDEALTITTTNMKASLGALSRNAPGSAARTVIERYRLSRDGQSMSAEITVDDPLYLTRPIVLRTRLVKAPPDANVEAIPCDVSASQRHLHRSTD